MKKYFLFIICLLIFPVWSYSQEILSLSECHRMAKENYPLIRRYALIDKAREFNLSNAGKGYLPQVSLSAKASYQSEVTKIPVTVPGIDIKGMSKDQYSATIEITQTIWDGGAISAKKDATTASADVEQKQLDVDMYAINDRVNQMYFGILLLDARLKQNDLLQEELQRNFNRISSSIEYGVANQADLDAVKVEQLKAVQNKAQLQSNRKSYLNMLAVMIGREVDEKVVLQTPRGEELLTSQVNRPELQLFDAQLNSLEVQKKSIKAASMPRFGLFLTGGYGRPGLNMLENDFSPYYIGGVRLSWNFGSLYTQKNDKKIIGLNQDNVIARRETFLFNTGLEATQEQQEIQKNRDLLKYDDEIISLRNSVKKAAEAKVANGTMSVLDLMREINNEDMARQDKIQHETELLLSIYNLKFTTNN